MTTENGILFISDSLMRMNNFEFICAEQHIDFENTRDEGLMIEQDAIAQKVLRISPDTINFIASFGSRARGDDTRNSDLDIAISTSLIAVVWHYTD